jgi:hypothetical protein
MPWTNYAREQAMQLALTGGTTPTFQVALYEGSANPAGTPVELTADGYTRQTFIWEPFSANTFANDADIEFDITAETAWQGTAVLDGTGTWFWQDLASVATIPADATLKILTGQLLVTVTLS